MAQAVVLKTEERKGKGSRDSARLRKSGRVPAVLYGHKEAIVPVTVSADELKSALRAHARTVQIVVGGKNETVIIQDIQRDYLHSEVVHVDFRRVSADERIRTTVDVELRGTAPGATGGAALDQPLHRLHIECLALSIPDSIRVKIDGLMLGQAIHVKELELPEGVKVLEDPDAVVVQVKLATIVVEAPVILGEGAANEPEVIEKKKKVEEEEE
jgi:large subunit ribosomal protein L25